MRSWLRRHRWWLPALPVALALMLAAQSYRLPDLWWNAGSHREVASADQGEALTVTGDPGFDGVGEFTRRYEVTLDEVAEAPYEPTSITRVAELPPGTVALEARLSFAADPDEILATCRVELVAADGVRYGGHDSDPLGQGYVCTPPDRTGPLPAFFGTERVPVPPELARPERWSVAPVFVVPEDAEITEVRLSFDPPEYVTLRPAR